MAQLLRTGVSSLSVCGDRGLRLPLWAETAPASNLYNSALPLGAGLSWSYFRKQARGNGEGERQSLILSKKLKISPVSNAVCVGFDTGLDKVKLWCDMMRTFIRKPTEAIACCT